MLGTVTLFAMCLIRTDFFVVCDENEVRAVSCNDNDKVVWKTGHYAHLLHVPSHDVILVVCENQVVALNPETGSGIKSVRMSNPLGKIVRLCLFNNQVIAVSKVDGEKDRCSISYFSLK